MGYVYRYRDKKDGIIKYVGIVWSENRTLEQRIKEHELYDSWYISSEWDIEYITENINTRTDAEYFESHYISLYKTDKYFNIKKAGWGVSNFLPERYDWIRYDNGLQNQSDYISKLLNEIELLKDENERMENLISEKEFDIKNKSGIPYRCVHCEYKQNYDMLMNLKYEELKLCNDDDYITADEIIDIYKKGKKLNYISESYDDRGNLICKKHLFTDSYGMLIFDAKRIGCDGYGTSYNGTLYNNPNDFSMKNYNIFRTFKNIGNHLFHSAS